MRSKQGCPCPWSSNLSRIPRHKDTFFLTQKEPELETKSAWEEVLDKTSLPRYPLTATGRGMNVRLAEPSAGSLADPSSFTSQEDPSVMLSNLLSHLP